MELNLSGFTNQTRFEASWNFYVFQMMKFCLPAPNFLEVFFWNFLIPTIFLSRDRLEGFLDLQGVRNEESKRIKGRGEKGRGKILEYLEDRGSADG